MQTEKALFLDERMRNCLNILITLCKNKPEGVGFNEWKDAIIDKGICSTRTFQKNRLRLVKGGLVIEIKNPKHKSGLLFSPIEELYKITDFIGQLTKMPEQMREKAKKYSNPTKYFNEFVITILYTIFGASEIIKRIQQPESRKMFLYYVSEVLVELSNYIPNDIQSVMRKKINS